MKKNRIIAIFTTALLSFSLPFTSQNLAFAATKTSQLTNSTRENLQEDKASESNPENSDPKALLKEDLESL